jgi:secondary thiamine-phosphate synthase enzyme
MLSIRMSSQKGRDAVIVENHTIECRTRGDDHIVDLTGQVQAAIARTGVIRGQAALLVHGSTASLTTLEFEPGLVSHDISAALEGIAPRDARYEHEETWHDDNGHSHVRASLVGPSLALPIVDGSVPLGTWQQIVMIDSDTRPRRRTVHISIVGVEE